MDPTIELIAVTPGNNPTSPLSPYKTHTDEIPPVLIRTSTDNPQPVYVDLDKYRWLTEAKDRFGKVDAKNFKRAVIKCNPFERVNRSIFMNRAAIKLANICAVYHLLDDQPTYCSDLAGGPGGFVEYLLYKLPQCQVWGITLKSKTPSLNWNLKRLSSKRFTPWYGRDSTGNLYKYWTHYSKYLMENTDFNQGVDLTTADGGVDVETNDDYNLQEVLNTRLIMIEIATGLYTTRPRVDDTRPGGNMVIKIFDTVTKISADILFIVSQCFEQISIFKPLSSRPANQEKYLVCQHKLPRDQVKPWFDIIKEAIRSSKTGHLTSIFETLPNDFEEWLLDANDHSTDEQITYTLKILAELGEIDPSHSGGKSPLYDLFKCNLLWAIPDQPDGNTT